MPTKKALRQPDKTGGWDHMADAIRYLIWQEIGEDRQHHFSTQKTFRKL